MSTSVDTRVMELKFDNAEFTKKTRETLSKLEEFDKKLAQLESSKAMKTVSEKADSTHVDQLNKSLEQTQHHFSALEVMAVTALANITNSVVNLGKKLVSNLIPPITQGGLARAQNIELASFQFEGLKVDKSKGNENLSYYKEVMDAVLGTAYSYDVAAKAASQLAASNIGVKDTTKQLADGSKISSKVMTSEMTHAILGIAGVAAMTGANFEDISQVFTRVAGQGKVMATDLNSIAARGLNASAVLAAELGKTEAEIRDMVTKGKISFEDFSNAMYKAYGDHAKDATQLFTGAMEDVKAALSRIGADFYGPMLTAGRDMLNALTPLVDAIHARITGAMDGTVSVLSVAGKKIEGLISKIAFSINYFNAVHAGESIKLVNNDTISIITRIADNVGVGSKIAADGIDRLGKGIKGVKIDGIKMLADYLNIGKKSVRQGLKDGTIGLEDFRQALKKLHAQSTEMQGTKGLTDALFGDNKNSLMMQLGTSARYSEEFVSGINRVRLAIATIENTIDILGDIISNAFRTLKNLAITLAPAGRIVLNLADNILVLTSEFTDLMAQSGAIQGFFEGLQHILEKIVAVFHLNDMAQTIYNAITKIFDIGMQAITAIGEGLNKFGKLALSFFDHLLNKVAAILGDVELLDVIFKDFKISTIIAIIYKIYQSIVKPLKAMQQLSAVTIGFLDKVVKDFKNSIEAIAKIGTTITKVFKALTGVLAEMQKTLKGALLFEIAAAILVLCEALKILASIDIQDPKQLIAPLVGLVAAFGILFTIMNYILKLNEKKEEIKHAGGFKGFIAGLADKLLKDSGPDPVEQIKAAGLMMMEVAAAIAIIGKAIEGLAQYNWKELLAPVGAIELVMLTMMGMAKKLSYETSTGVFAKDKKAQKLTSGLLGLVFIAEAVKMVGQALSGLAGMSWSELWPALTSVEAVLITLGGIAKWLASDRKKFVAGGASMLLMAIGVRIIASAVSKIAEIKDANRLGEATLVIEAIMISLAGMAEALNTMALFSISDGIGILLIAAAIRVAATALSNLADIDADKAETAVNAFWSVVAALGGLAAILAQSEKFTLDDAVSMIAIAAAIKVLSEVVGYFGEMDQDRIINGLLALAGTIVVLWGAIKAFENVKFTGILKFLGTLGGIILEVAAAGFAFILLGAGLRALAAAVPAIAETVPYLDGFATAILALVGTLVAAGLIIQAAVEPIVAALALLAGITLILVFASKAFERIATAFDKLSKMNSEGLKGAAKAVASFVKTTVAMAGKSKTISEAAESMSEAFAALNNTIKQSKKAIAGLSTVGSNMISEIAKGISSKTAVVKAKTAVNAAFTQIHEHMKNKQSEWKSIGSYLIQGMIKGIAGQQSALEDQVVKLEEKAERAVKAKSKIQSPSRVWMTIGGFMGRGLAIGIANSANSVSRAAVSLADKSGKVLTDAISTISDKIENGIDASPTITPVVDLSNVESAAGTINSLMATRRAMSLAASISRSPSRMEAATHQIMDGMKDMFYGAGVGIQNGSGSPVEITVPLSVDGKKIASATAVYMQSELDKVQARNDRLVGNI